MTIFSANRYLLAVAALGLALAACHSPTTETPETSAASAAALLIPGPWRGVLRAQGQEIPFLFEVKTEAGKPVLYLVNKGLNGEERLRCDEISAAGDSVTVRMHVFDAALVLRGDGKEKLKGTWVKYDAKEPYRVPLVATAGEQPLFAANNYKVGVSFAGTYRTGFKDETDNVEGAIGIFEQTGNNVTGTFLSNTGDYRYLAGQVVNSKVHLSTFDGSHAYLFVGQFRKEITADDGSGAAYGDTICYVFGDFYSGKSGHETWYSIPDSAAKPFGADRITKMKEGESRLDFNFPSIVAGRHISPTDAKYRGKVVVVQLLGSWCPNCLDESNFLAPWYEQNKQRGVEIIGLGYERSADYAKAAARLRNLRERLHIGYELAVAGVSNKDSVAKSLPQLATFLAFPTTIFLDKKGNVRKIHTGYAGPGTGKYYEEEKAAFEREVDKLLAE